MRRVLKLSNTDERKERARSLRLAVTWKRSFKDFLLKAGVHLANSVERSVVDLKTRTKQVGSEEKARRIKCDVRFSHTNYMTTGVRKLLRMGLVLA